MAVDAPLSDTALAVLTELAQQAEPVSSARLCKKLGLRMSTLLRTVAYLGEAAIAGSPGLGLVQRHEEADRLLLGLTPQGRAVACAAMAGGVQLDDLAPAQAPSIELPWKPSRALSVMQPVLQYRDGHAQQASDVLAQETPIAMVYNGISHAVMMATPADLEAFAVGFSLSEGIVEHVGQIYDIACQPQDAGIELQLRIHGAPFAALKERRRQLTGPTGCGLCGMESLRAVEQGIRPVPCALTVPRSAIMAAMRELPQHQPLNAATGALHVAAWADAQGRLQYAMEDVGRHNALDKLVGTLARRQVDAGTGWVLMSSRASYELVQKCARAGVSVLATVSAPTAMAVRLAEQAGICLIGFVRANGLVVYSFSQRVVMD